jgi:hypothetical protein
VPESFFAAWVSESSKVDAASKKLTQHLPLRANGRIQKPQKQMPHHLHVREGRRAPINLSGSKAIYKAGETIKLVMLEVLSLSSPWIAETAKWTEFLKALSVCLLR